MFIRMCLGAGWTAVYFGLLIGLVGGPAWSQSTGSEAQFREITAETAKGVYLLCRAHNDAVQQMVDSSLNVSRYVMNQAGAVSFSEEPVLWDAINQYTKVTSQVKLPKMIVGKTWLGQNRSLTTLSPVVDTVKELVGGTCTIFQRMNEAGDILRVCTNVENLDGTRAVGTYIPAVNPDGQPNPVVSTVMKGVTYRGRAYVVNAWYITAYEPILDKNGKVVGVLYVGTKQECVDSVRQGIMDIVVGKTGYVYVLDQQGRYVISKDGERDGENIWDETDADGRLFIQSIIKKALAGKDGSVDFERYPWKNKGETTARMKVAAVTHFSPWDWIICVGAYEDDFK
ncbi:MAG: Cache 3/Cache 2 fusion domain-containing protein [bacterium]